MGIDRIKGSWKIEFNLWHCLRHWFSLYQTEPVPLSQEPEKYFLVITDLGEDIIHVISRCYVFVECTQKWNINPNI
ncbi:MAG: hypothetical protein C4B58_11165 [Deltaproteobacteria bacterium]|nr:MAG: hypothetical protein C4B58_11165 [Deltaproteobacteria bacterium]